MNPLKRHSRELDRAHSLAHLYAAGLNAGEIDQPFAGVFFPVMSMSPCHIQAGDQAKLIAESCLAAGITPFQNALAGVNDNIPMGGNGMRYSLPTRQLNVDQVCYALRLQSLDCFAMVPTCDKHVAAAGLALCAIDRPGIIVTTGSMRPGLVGGHERTLQAVYEGAGKFSLGVIGQPELLDLTMHACDKQGGGCAGLATYNTLSLMLGAMGLTLVSGAASVTATALKEAECRAVGAALRAQMEADISPKRFLTREALLNAVVVMVSSAGSTNGVLHVLAWADALGIPLSLAEIEAVSAKTPVLLNVQPNGQWTMNDMVKAGGAGPFYFHLLERGLISDVMTVTGRRLSEELTAGGSGPAIPDGQEVIFPVERAIRPRGDIRVLTGNLARDGAVAKISGAEGERFTGKARVFNDEQTALAEIEAGRIPKGTVIIIRYVGPREGMPEMLRVTGFVKGRGMDKDVALVTDGRFSGFTRGFCVGHVSPAASEGGDIALIEDGDEVVIDAEKGSLVHRLTKTVLRQRRARYSAPVLDLPPELLAWAALVGPASEGCRRVLPAPRRPRWRF